MSIKNYNVPPYYDDFDQSKNYVRVLFRPGYAVQARELTQLQTSIQAQIDRFGSHVFKEGSPVLGGQASLDTAYEYVKLESTFSDSGTDYYPEGDGGTNLSYFASSVGTTVTGVTSGITATVLEAIGSTNTDALTIFVRYTRASTATETTHQFSPTEILTFTVNGSLKKFKVKALGANPVGRGTRVSVNEGVYFVKGSFVYTSADSVVVSKYTTNPSARIVYRITENIVTAAEDSSLVDNSIGTPNESAPGAHRYQIALDLVVEPYSISSRTEDNIIQVLLINGGQVTGRARTEYSELARTLATRTYEESGNYTVRPFQINVREYYDNGSNGGLFSQAQIQAANPGFTSQQAIDYGKARLAVGLEPSVAYVSGYRIETLDTTYVPMEKARDEGYINGASLAVPLGGYIYVKSVVGLPDTLTFSTITLKNSSSTTIGTARARALEWAGNVSSTDYYRLYLFDIAMNSSYSIDQVATLVDTSVPGYDFSAVADDIDSNISTTVLYDPANSSLLYSLPVSAVQSLRSSDDITCDFYYQVKRKFGALDSNGSGQVELTTTSPEIFLSTTRTDYIVVKISDGSIVTQTADPVRSNGNTKVTLSLGSGNANSLVASGGGFYVIGSTQRNLIEKSKTFVSGVVTYTGGSYGNGQKAFSSPGASHSLAQVDVLRIKAIYMSPDSGTVALTSHTLITDRYSLDNGQRENFYDVARIQLKPGASVPTGQILVIFDYFTHGATGDYFGVNSYAGIDYGDIPTFNSVKGAISLRDAVDFRPTKSSDGTFSGAGSSLSNCPTPNSTILTDIQFYLPRIDKIAVNKNGEFSAIKGISGVIPKAPEDPEDSMILYTISLGAYTFGTSDLVAKMVDNKRYTMRDIGRLEKRLSNVEYYTSLSLLEKSAANAQILDSLGHQRYKNGFIVDSFVGHGIGAVSHPDYRCSIEAETGTLRPEFSNKYVNLIPNLDASTGVKQTGSLVTLDYREVTLIEQPYSSYSEYVNPHAVYGWQGRLELSPPSDEWKEVNTKPALAANAASSYGWVQEASANTVNRGIFNGWQINWFGVSPEEEGYLNSQISGQLGAVNLNYATSAAVGISATSTNGSTRTGMAYYGQSISTGIYANTQTTQVADTVVDNTIVPYMRSRKIYFRATGLKPYSKVYAFFDGVNVANYVRPESAMINYTTNPDDKDYSGLTSHPSTPGILYASPSGEVIGSFIIPHNDSLKFRTGERIFRLVDNDLNSIDSSFTYAESTYRATGIFVAAPTPATQPPVVIPTPRPGPAPSVPPFVGLSVEGRTPKYSGIPFNFNVSTAATGYGTLTSLTVKERSDSSNPSFGTWVPLAYISGNTSGGYSANATFRISPALPGSYQVQASAVWNGVTYYSNIVPFNVTQYDGDLGTLTEAERYN